MAYPLLENLGHSDKLQSKVQRVKVPSPIKKEKPLLASILEDLSMERQIVGSNRNSFNSQCNVIPSADVLRSPK